MNFEFSIFWIKMKIEGASLQDTIDLANKYLYWFVYVFLYFFMISSLFTFGIFVILLYWPVPKSDEIHVWGATISALIFIFTALNFFFVKRKLK